MEVIALILRERFLLMENSPAGKKQLLSEQSKWDLFVQAVAGIMRPAD